MTSLSGVEGGKGWGWKSLGALEPEVLGEGLGFRV